ncbi:hypothetical protein ACQP00_23860 [Dactylosporangium sp. CS-047395]|uniref:hypothetical protein n=1 Tax=Dactylosporangium sp. CS-047395 TaxID=3239936 RepID=UPI003D904BAD
MTDAVTRRWQEADDAVESLVATLAGAVARAERGQSRKSRTRTRPKRETKSTRRYLAEVIRSHRLAPGLTVDRNMIAALFTGHRELVANPTLVVAVAQACGIIAGRKLTGKETAKLRAASERVARLIARAQAAGPVPEPAPPAPVPDPGFPPPVGALPDPGYVADLDSVPPADSVSTPGSVPAPAPRAPLESLPIVERLVLEPVAAGPIAARPDAEAPVEKAPASHRFWLVVALAVLVLLLTAALWLAVGR